MAAELTAAPGAPTDSLAGSRVRASRKKNKVDNLPFVP
jgi:hypothetical protein